MDARQSAHGTPASGHEDHYIVGTRSSGTGNNSADNVTVPNAEPHMQNDWGRDPTTGPTIDPRSLTAQVDVAFNGDMPAAEDQPAAPTSAVPENANLNNGIVAQPGQDISPTNFKCPSCKFWVSFPTKQELAIHLDNGRHFDYIACELDDYIVRAAMSYGQNVSWTGRHINTLRGLFKGVTADWVERVLDRNEERNDEVKEEYYCHMLFYILSREGGAVPADSLQAVFSTLDRELNDFYAARFGYRCECPSLAGLNEKLLGRVVAHEAHEASVKQAVRDISESATQAACEVTVALNTVLAQISNIPFPRAHVGRRRG